MHVTHGAPQHEAVGANVARTWVVAITYVIAQPCIDRKEQSCIEVCPVDCISETDRMLVIDPSDCIDCGACVPECPVDAIYPDDALPEEWREFAAINAAVEQGAGEVTQLVAIFEQRASG